MFLCCRKKSKQYVAIEQEATRVRQLA